ncbi:SDR family oxidoreductase [Undibacterium sp. TJN25]|uniref:SDR family oxidoreductase n=1 Tax=Undibacterium sp. TJN25 TaxID=3413056 RepID=UPI003BF05048
MFNHELLKDKRILVTGGGTGLGYAMSRRFAELGASLVLCGRRQQVLEQAATELRRDFGAEVAAIACDIRDPDAVEAMMQRIWEDGALDILVNNAAASFIARTESLSARAADAILGVTLHGALYCTLAAGKRWITDRHAGTVLSILSTSTVTGRAYTVPSAMAKSALLAMTRSLAVEWGPKDIRLVAIAPGPFPTAAASANLNPAGRQNSAGHANPLGRSGDPAELANLAAYLVSGFAGYINGEMIAIDGGQHLRTSGAEDLLRWTDEQWQQLRKT